MKTGSYALGNTERRTGAQNMKTGPDTPRTDENESESAKYEHGMRHPRYRRKWVREDPTPSAPPKTCLGAQNMKTGPSALGTIENESGSAKHEKGSWRPRYHRKWVRELKTWKRNPTPSEPPKMRPGAQNMKTGSDALRTVKNVFGSANHRNGTRRRRYHRKLVRERKTWKKEPSPFAPPKTSPRAQNIKKNLHELIINSWYQINFLRRRARV
jgi:hypothetical protein